jgi:cytochrome c biogenesis protein
VDDLTKFTATYSATGEALNFRADLTYRDNPDAPEKSASITVNHPLRTEGDRIYLLSHGFSPQVTVTMPDGTVRHEVAPFMTTDASTLLSEGVFKLLGKPGANQDVGISGMFAPTPADQGNGLITSVSPQVNDPVLSIFVYTGSLNYTGLPQSVFTLDTSKMTQVGKANLSVGQSQTFHGVSVRFDGWLPWVSLQVSHDPAQDWLLLAAAVMVVGMFGSLTVRRRRLWVRVVSPAADSSHTVVQVGGLARNDSGNFTAEFNTLLEKLRAGAAPGAEELGSGELADAGKELNR